MEEIAPDNSPDTEDEAEETSVSTKEWVIPEVVGAYEIDTDFEDAPNELFDGKTLDHEIWGKLPLKVVNGRLFAEVSLACEHTSEAYNRECKSGLKHKCYLGSGLHAGAWCYAYNIETLEYEACLRDQVFVCEECKAKREQAKKEKAASG